MFDIPLTEQISLPQARRRWSIRLASGMKVSFFFRHRIASMNRLSHVNDFVFLFSSNQNASRVVFARHQLEHAHLSQGNKRFTVPVAMKRNTQQDALSAIW